LIYGTFHISEDAQKQKKEAAKKNGKIWDWKMTSENHRGVYLTTKNPKDQAFPQDTVHTLKDFLAHLASAGVIDPHVECHELSTTYQKSPDGEVTGVTTTVKNVQDCCFRVLPRPANCRAEYDNLGSTLVLGSGHADWDMTTGKHKKGLLCIHDRMSYDETPQMTGIAFVKPGICLAKAILVKQNTLRQLT